MSTNDFLGHSSKRTFSRRALFRGSFAGLGAAMFLRTAEASPQESTGRSQIDEATTAEVTFNYPLVTGTGGFNNTFGCFVNGWCVIAAGSNRFSTIQCLDIQSGNPNPQAPYWFTEDTTGQQLPALGTLVAANGFAIAPGGDGKFWVVNVSNVALANRQLGVTSIAPPTALSPVITYGDSLVYISTDAHLNAITVSAPHGNDVGFSQVWRVPLGIRGAAHEANVAVNGSRAVATWGRFLAPFDISGETPQSLWEPRDTGENITGLDVDDSTVYIARGSDVSAYSLESNVAASPWKNVYRASRPGAPVCYNAAVYFADDAGKFTALDAATGLKLWSVDLVGGAGNQTPITIEDGIAYVTTSSTVNAIDLINRTNLTYNGGIVEFLGVENGVAFVVAGDQANASLVGVDLGLQIHGFACESKLLADSVESSANAQPSKPAFRTVVQLLDPSKNPRAFVSVKLWASDAVTIDAEGNTIALTGSTNGAAGTSFLWLTTDASGTIYFASQAADVSSPAIYLWASFMDTEEAMVLYPDQDAANDLATVTAGAFSSKATFDGSPLLADGVDPSAAASAIGGIMGGNGSDAASTLTSTRARQRQRASRQVEQQQRLGTTVRSRRRMLTVQADNSYLAYPDSTTSLLYQQFAGPTDRSFDTTNVTPFQLTFNPKTGQLSFESGTSITPQQVAGLGLKDFVKRVVHGAERVTQAICNKVGYAVTHFITTIVDGIEYAYNITVGAIEDAIHVAVGVLKSIVRDVKNALQKVVEWLSFVFSWAAIKATKEEIYNRVVGKGSYPGLANQLRSWEQKYAEKGLKELQKFFDNASQQILGALSGVDDQFQNTTLQSQQQDGNDPKSNYNMNGASAYVPASMITAKVNANMDNAQELPSVSAFESAASLIDLAEKVFHDAAKALGPQLDDLKASLQRFIDSFRLLMTDPGKFIGTAFNQLTALLRQVAVLLMQAVAAIVGSLVGNLADMVEQIVSSLLAPIHIPVVSNIWNAIFRSSMSYLDLACWMTAIPASIITRATSSSFGADREASKISIYSFLATVPAATFDGLVDFYSVKPGTFPQMIKMAFAAIPLTLSFPFDFANSDDSLDFYYALNAIPFILGGISQAIGKLKGPETAFTKTWGGIATNITFTSGVCSILLSCLAAFYYKAPQFIGPSHLKFCQNFFSSLKNVCKQGLFFGPEARIAVSITDVIFPVTASGLGIAASAAA